jgi:hypothetical protein
MISGNVVVVTNGAVVQGIFVGADSKFEFDNVDISNNFLYGTSFNGIAASYTNDLTLSGNELLALPGKVTKIVVLNSDHVTLTDNDASRFNFSNDTTLTQTNDTTNSGVTDLGAAAMRSFELLHPEMAPLLDPFIALAPAAPVTPSAPLPAPVPSVPVMPDVGTVIPMGFMPPISMFGPGEFIL